MIWFTADQHFNGRGAIKHNGRPFATTEEMDQALADAWNERVGPRDEVYVLGDFAMPKRPAIPKLKGKKFLVRGNHDIWDPAAYGFTDLGWYHKFRHEKRRIILCHFPFATWDGSGRNTWHLHGHSHGNLRLAETTRLDVGVDNTVKFAGHYGPISFDEVVTIMESRVYVPCDHHEGGGR